jgi:hypothetical protein
LSTQRLFTAVHFGNSKSVKTGGRIMKRLNVVGWAVLLAACCLSRPALAQVNLGSYNVNPNTVTVAGVSSGGFMAVQLQVAYSRSIFGTSVMAGGT